MQEMHTARIQSLCLQMMHDDSNDEMNHLELTGLIWEGWP